MSDDVLETYIRQVVMIHAIIRVSFCWQGEADAMRSFFYQKWLLFATRNGKTIYNSRANQWRINQ